jgi:predicted nucleotidyltransferase
MHPAILRNLGEIKSLAERFGVRRLDLIGSALRTEFDDAASDFDFVVEFDSLTTSSAADRYFGLLHELEDLFDRPVDLVSYTAIRNPYFKTVIDQTRTSLHAA